MQYIRTKDGHICKIRNKQKRLDGEYDTWYVGNNVSLLYNHDHNSIDKEADTIQELCDEFAVYLEGENDNLPMTVSKEVFDVFKKTILLGMKGKLNCWLKGGIWTDKGFIYVAKMNENGEMELL